MTERRNATGGPALVTGATYFLGAHTALALARRGERVRCLPSAAESLTFGPSSGGDAVRDRREAVTAAAPDGARLEWLDGDILDVESLRRAASGCRVVYHCDEDYRLWSRDPDDVYRHNVEGTRRVLRAAREAGVERVVHTSSVGCLGPTEDGLPADEETPARLDQMVGHYQRSKFLAERVVEEASRGLPVVVVNPSACVGGLDFHPTPVGRLVVDFLQGRVPAVIDAGRNFVDVRDVARGHLLAAKRGVAGRRYVLAGHDLTVQAFLELLARITGRTPPRLRMPRWVALAYAALQEAGARIGGGAPRVPLETVRAAKRKIFCDASRAERELGWSPSPLEPALERAVRWFRASGHLEA